MLKFQTNISYIQFQIQYFVPCLTQSEWAWLWRVAMWTERQSVNHIPMVQDPELTVTLHTCVVQRGHNFPPCPHTKVPCLFIQAVIVQSCIQSPWASRKCWLEASQSWTVLFAAFLSAYIRSGNSDVQAPLALMVVNKLFLQAVSFLYFTVLTEEFPKRRAVFIPKVWWRLRFIL